VDDLRRLEAKGLARAKARSRRLRVSRIRSLTFRGSLALFLLLWAVVFVQLASGNDPALNKIPKKAQRQRQPTPATREPLASREPAPEFEPEVEEPVEVEPEFEEPEFEEPEAEPEVEFEEPEPEPEPEPVITGSS
jgi:outer membrane biosynthesis protein TonB